MTEVAHLALGGGVVWSLIALVRGAAVADVAWLAVSGGLTLWILLAALGTVSGDRLVLSRVAVATALLLLGSLALGAVLEARTHHRPLGSVTWVMLSLFMAIGTLLVALRLRLRAEFAAALFSTAVALGLWRLAPTVDGALALETGVGLAVVGGAVWLRRFLGPRLDRFWVVSAAVMSVGCVGALALGLSERLHQIAPVVAGPVGLLH